MKRIAILASGNGTNAENIIKYFEARKTAEVALIVTNKADAFVIERAKNYQIPAIVFNSQQLSETNLLPDTLTGYNIDYIVLAGFLLKIPENILTLYPDKIINIHPALLPKYGGKGMYGDFVHEKVIEEKEKESGISIHFVNEKYDEGKIIFQAKCTIDASDNPATLAAKIHELEYRYFPEIIEQVILKQNEK
jgi:phosphoribosylglycinamide formyltransferase 1